jgi:hypothetical protein
MKQGPGLKCYTPPAPPANTKYLSINSSLDDIEIGQKFFFQCPRSMWRKTDNHTEMFGFPCRPDINNEQDPQGKYLLETKAKLGGSNATTNATDDDEVFWEICTRDPKYNDGCKVMDRMQPSGLGKTTGLFIDPTNPDNVLIGDSLRYICPENADVPGQFLVASWNMTFKVECVADGQFERMRKNDWPGCRVPGTCALVDGPAVPEDSGMVSTYEDRTEFSNISFKCTDKTQEPVGSMVVEREGQGKVMEVMCGRGAEPGVAAWEVPAEWPSCTFKDEFSCDPSTELVIPDWTSLIPENTKFILYNKYVSSTARSNLNPSLPPGLPQVP